MVKAISMGRRHLLGGAVASAAALVGRPASAAPVRRLGEGLRIEAVQMPAWLDRDGRRHPLAAGDLVSAPQVIETGVGAALVMGLPEGSQVNLGEKSRLSVASLAQDRVEGIVGVRADLRLFEGFFRFATSAVSRVTGRRAVSLTLRTTTVGVRGTDFWSMTDAQHDAVCLFEGQVALDTRDQGSLSLDLPGAFWTRVFDRAVQPVGVATPEQLAGFIASSALKAGQGIAVAGGAWQVRLTRTSDSRAAMNLAGTVRAVGYPATLHSAGSVHEVRIAQLATRTDAQALLGSLRAFAGEDAGVMVGL